MFHKLPILKFFLENTFHLFGCRVHGKNDSLGVHEESSYWNDAMSIGCTFGSKWYFYTDEEIAEQNGLATGMLREDYAKLVEESGSMMDMLAGGFNLCADIAAWVTRFFKIKESFL